MEESENYTPVILEGQTHQDDELLEKRPPLDERELSGHGSEVVMELLQRFKVRDVMKRKILSVARETPLREAQRIMRENHISGVPVAENGRLFGIISVNDIITALDGGWIAETCEKHMSTNLVVLESDMPLAFAIKYFQNYTFGRFPVLDKDRNFVGIVSQRDVTRVLMQELTNELARLEGKPVAPAVETKSEGSNLPYYSMRQFVVVHNDLSNAGKAANEIKKMMKDAGVNSKLIRRVAVAAYELEINICIHSVGGTLTFVLDDRQAQIVAKDNGPGIKDVEWALRDGTSTANDWIRSMGFGAGMGLSNSKRVSDTFDIVSKVPNGTTVMCGFKIAP